MASSAGSRLRWWWCLSSIFLAIVPGVLCADDYSIGGLVAAGAVTFLLLAVIIAMITAGLTWNNWYPKLQWAKGKVKMPKAYWKKKEEAKLRLLHGSRSALASVAAQSDSGLPNGNTSSRVRDTGSLKASWVQGWNNANHMDDGGYEEMALAMDLGEEEREEDVRIVTTILDNETLDIAPFKDTDSALASTASGAAGSSIWARAGEDARDAGLPPASGQVTETEGIDPAESYIYTTVDRSAKKSSAASTRQAADADAEMRPAVGSAVHDGDEGPAATSEKVTSFPKMDPYLVAL